MLAYAVAAPGRGPYGKAGWVVFRGGYREFRAVVGKRASSVNLSLTGKMLKDVHIESSILDRNVPVGLGKSNTFIARVKLVMSFNTRGSEEVAGRVESGRFGRPFFSLTEKEIMEVADFMSTSVLNQRFDQPRDARGRFVRL